MKSRPAQHLPNRGRFATSADVTRLPGRARTIWDMEDELDQAEVRYMSATYRSHVWCTGCRRTFGRDEVAGARHAAAARHIVQIRRIDESFVGPTWDLDVLLHDREMARR